MAKNKLDALKNSIGSTVKKTNRISFIPTETEKQVADIKDLVNKVAAIPIEKIALNPKNPRKYFADEALKSLADSIAKHGVIQPITVQDKGDNTYELISGERRLKAAKKANKKAIPAYIRPILEDESLLELALVENLIREDLNPIEIAETYEKLQIELGINSHEKLAERLGIGRSSVTNKLGLLKLSSAVRNALIQKQITEGHAKWLTGIESIDDQNDILKIALKEKLSVRALEKLVKSWGNKSKQKKTKSGNNPTPRLSERSIRRIGHVFRLSCTGQGQ